jgi:hypothetical protein
MITRAVQRMSRTNLFVRSSDSQPMYASEALGPHLGGFGGSHDSADALRMTHNVVWSASERRLGSGTAAAAAAGAASGAMAGALHGAALPPGSEHTAMEGSLHTSTESSEGLVGGASGPGTAAGSESDASSSGAGAGGGVTSIGSGKRWSSGSNGSAHTPAAHDGDGGLSVVTTGLSGSDRADSSEAEGSTEGSAGGLGALDTISRHLRPKGSRRSRRHAQRKQPQQQQAGGDGGGMPPTYQTISELHSTSAQVRGACLVSARVVLRLC